LLEIEVPAKPQQYDQDVGQAAPLIHAREQIASWRAWFRDPLIQLCSSTTTWSRERIRIWSSGSISCSFMARVKNIFI
jgi:hypothetical protein